MTETKEETILSLVRSGVGRLTDLTLAAKHTRDDDLFSDDRIKREREVDRVLQKLRRNGKIVFSKESGWRIVEGWKL